MFVFSQAVSENNLLYSKYAGEVSLLGPEFSPNTKLFEKRILVYPGKKNEHDWEKMGQTLSKWGTLAMAEDHGQTYYAFDCEVPTEEIVKEVEGLKVYGERYVVPAKKMFLS